MIHQLRETIRRLFSQARLQQQLQQERRQLRALTDDELRDIGIDRQDAEREAARSRFDVPSQRRIASEQPPRGNRQVQRMSLPDHGTPGLPGGITVAMDRYGRGQP